MSRGKLAYAPLAMTTAAVLAASLLNTAHADLPCSPPCCTQPTSQPVCPTDPPVEHEYDDGNFVVLEAVVNSADAGALSLGQHPAVAIEDPDGVNPARFIVAWESGVFEGGLDFPSYNLVVASAFEAAGSCVDDPRALSDIWIVAASPFPPPLRNNFNYAASAAASADGRVRVGWLGVVTTYQFAERTSPTGATLRTINFDLNSSPSGWPAICPYPEGYNDNAPSVGISDGTSDSAFVSWTRDWNFGVSLQGLLYGEDFGVGEIQLRDCVFEFPGDPDPYYVEICEARTEQWQPCLSMRNDGYFVITWAEPDQDWELFAGAFFGVRIQLFDPAGNPIPGPSADGLQVNDDSTEIDPSSQVSPAVSMDDAGNVVVVWTGPPLLDPQNPGYACSGGSRVYARRLRVTLDGNNEPNGLAFASAPFIVNNNADFKLVGDDTKVHPTVSLSRANDGRFVVAWNATDSSTQTARDIHAQYFDGARPLGREFRVNQVPYSQDEVIRQIGTSAQHTAAYGPDGEVVFAWSTSLDGNNDADIEGEVVQWTRFPNGFAEYLERIDTCCKGDVNRDGHVNGLDIQPFIDLVLAADISPRCRSIVDNCPADTNLDADVTLADIPTFVVILLQAPDCSEEPELRGLTDCNGNNVPDANDIAEGTSQDCNQNFIPDECDIADETSVDIDGNGVPDECQPDCNGNDIPDAWDIDPLDPDGNEEVSADCNENGIPDECERDCNSNGVPDDCDVDPLDPDGDEWVSADCNANGIPDECEADCNHNGVPDGCDLDPADPDGDEWVSPDCNENGVPDECEFSLPPPLGSYDCNDNDVPDECDIADETSCDANANGVPDECEIALEACDDLDEDGCCDEGESLMGGGQGGGESMMGGEGGESSSESESTDSQSPCAELTEAECWDLYFEWAMEQCWGRDCEATGFEQFRAARAKLAELGLTWPM